MLDLCVKPQVRTEVKIVDVALEVLINVFGGAE